jgi:hypothetical protein
MAQITLAGSNRRKPSGGNASVNMPVRAAMGAASRKKCFPSIPMTVEKPVAGGKKVPSGRDGTSDG